MKKYLNLLGNIYIIFLTFPFPLFWQVSTWFANARRRLKKENKMTWEPKNKLDDEDVDVSDDDDKDRDDDDKSKSLCTIVVSFSCT